MPLTPSAVTTVPHGGQALCCVQPGGEGWGPGRSWPCGDLGVSQGPQSEQMACPEPGPPSPADFPPLGVPSPPPPGFREQGDCCHHCCPLAAWTPAWWPTAARAWDSKLRSGCLAHVPVAAGLLESLTSGLGPGPGHQGAQGLPLVLCSQPRGPLPTLPGRCQGPVGWGVLCSKARTEWGAWCPLLPPFFPASPWAPPSQTVLRDSQSGPHGAGGLAGTLLSGVRVHHTHV